MENLEFGRICAIFLGLEITKTKFLNPIKLSKWQYSLFEIVHNQNLALLESQKFHKNANLGVSNNVKLEF